MRKSSLFALSLIVTLITLELTVRAYFALQVGPRIVLYGTPWHQNRQRTIAPEKIRKIDQNVAARTVVFPGNESAGYTKFFPNESKFDHDVDTGQKFRVRINSRGFRGADFETKKKDGVIRVVTLGSSSTFGFYSKDDQTYPVVMQAIIDERCEDRDFEILNLAIPHMTTDNIAALFFAEVLDLNPDIVTFYEGINDSSHYPISAGQDTTGGFAESFLALKLFDYIWNGRVQIFSGSHFDQESKAIRGKFIENLSRVHRACKERGIQFIVANQQAQPRSYWPKYQAAREKLRGVTYADEVEVVGTMLAEGQALTRFEYTFLIHNLLMKSLQQWTSAEGIEFVDAIGALDQERHNLVSWVHLHPNGNLRLASLFADRVLEVACNAPK